MASLLIVAQSGSGLAGGLLDCLRRVDSGGRYHLLPSDSFCNPNGRGEHKAENAYVYVPSYADDECMIPDLWEARRVFQQFTRLWPHKLVLLSSALIYGTGAARQSLVSEDYSAPGQGRSDISGRWKSLEALAQECWNGSTPFTILRPTTVLPSPALLSRRIMRPMAVTLAGHDPMLQLLGLEDLARAILCAVRSTGSGVFNVAPDGVVPLHAAIKLAQGYRLPLPRTWQQLVRYAESLEYLRYPWTVSNQKIKDQLGFMPRQSSAEVARASRQQNSAHSGRKLAQAPAEFDDFGMDRSYIERLSGTVFKFLSNRYWRIEAKGIEHIPGQGRAILVGTHRGFIPWDAVMTLHLVLENTGRIPRYLTHPGLLKFPFISNFMTKLGGVVACQQSADSILARDELLGVFPEGVQGAFTPYRQTYQLRSFGRDSFVKLALRHRAPIIPYVTVGSAEIYPIFAQIKSRHWTRYSEWPCLPISTFPLLPLPLPTKWHLQFLPAINLHERYGQEAAQNPAIIREISAEVRLQMQHAVEAITRRRRSWFWGSVFQPEKGS
jgi:1-acyl-sn-glycerol-3-phosphate acyltransferase/nucleoside-diphosphate-sugar epimerase